MNNNNKGVKALIITLAVDNVNQREFLGSVRVTSGQLDASKFLARGHSRSRKAVRADLTREAVKLETKTDSSGDGTAAKAATKKMKSSSSTRDEDDDDAGSSQGMPIVVYDEDLGQDDIEAAVMGNLPVFLSIDSDSA